MKKQHNSTKTNGKSMFLTVPAHEQSSKDEQVYGLHHGTFFCPSNKSIVSPEFNCKDSSRQTSAYARSLKFYSSLGRAEGWATLTAFATSRWMNWRSGAPESEGTINVLRQRRDMLPTIPV